MINEGYDFYHGSKQKVGWIESTIDGSKFAIEKATIRLDPTFPRFPSTQDDFVLDEQECMIDFKHESESHQIEYLMDTGLIPVGMYYATFTLTLQGGEVTKRRVDVTIR